MIYFYNPLFLYIEVNLICVVVLAFILIRSIGRDLIPRWGYFVICIALMITNIVCDTFWQLIDTHLIPGVRWVDVLLKSTYFVSLTIMSFMWFLYFESIRKSAFSAWRLSIFFSGVFVYAHVVLMILNLDNGWLFTVDGILYYQRGPLFAIQYLFPCVYVMTAIIRSAITSTSEHNYIEKASFVVGVVCPLIPMAASGLQFFFRRAPLLAPSLMLVILFLYNYLMESAVRYDPLTGLSNRRVLMSSLSRWMKNPSESGLYLFMIDVDFFKKINDSYGHIEGDNALVNVSDILSSAVETNGRHALTARYGGDEFNIVLDATSYSDADELLRRIEALTTDKNKTDAKPYRLSLSIGLVKYDPQAEHTVRDLINAADHALYIVKKQRHTERL